MYEDVVQFHVNFLTVMAVVINFMTDMDSNVIGSWPYLTILSDFTKTMVNGSDDIKRFFLSMGYFVK